MTAIHAERCGLWRQRHAKHLLPLTLGGTIALATAGCARYQSQPLDLREFSAQWRQASVAPELSPVGDQGPVDLDDGVSLAEAELIALVYHPELRTLRLRAGVPLAAADQAGRWSDPELGVEVEHILEEVDEPWVVMGSLAITIPLSGSPSARRRLRAAEADAALAQVLAQEWALRQALRRAWTDWSRAQALSELLARHGSALAALLDIAEQLHAGGQLDAPQIRAIRLAHATAGIDREDATTAAQVARLDLLALCGLHPDSPLRLQPSLELTSPELPEDELELLLTHPELRAAMAAYQVAERSLALAVRRQYPDLRIGLGGGVDGGQSRLAFGLGLLPIPIWNGNGEEIATTRAERAASGSDTQAVLQTLTHRLAVARHEHLAATSRLTRLRESLLPMVEAQERDLRLQAERGRIDVALLLDAQQRGKDLRLRALDAQAQAAQATIALQDALGPLQEPALHEPDHDDDPDRVPPAVPLEADQEIAP